MFFYSKAWALISALIIAAVFIVPTWSVVQFLLTMPEQPVLTIAMGVIAELVVLVMVFIMGHSWMGRFKYLVFPPKRP